MSSTIIIASAPFGISAPVIHWIHSPFPMVISDGEPAELTSTTFNSIGSSSVACFVSIARTANPSIAELSKIGDGKDATIFSPKIRPGELIRSTFSLSKKERCLFMIVLAF